MQFSQYNLADIITGRPYSSAASTAWFDSLAISAKYVMYINLSIDVKQRYKS